MYLIVVDPPIKSWNDGYIMFNKFKLVGAGPCACPAFKNPSETFSAEKETAGLKIDFCLRPGRPS